MMFWRRENYLNYPVLVFHREGARDGDCLPGEPGGYRGIVAGSLEKAGVRQIFFFPAIWSLPGSCLGRPKESRGSHLFQLVGVSRRWVTASTLVGGTGSHQPTCGYPQLFLFSSVSPLFVFVSSSYLSLCSGKGCPTHTPTPFQRARVGVTLKWSLHAPC